MLQFASLGSGSKGNGTLVRHGDSIILVDCGFTLKETQRRLQRLNIQPENLSAVIVTHEHSDHIGGVGPLARKFKLPIYMTPGTYRARDIGQIPNLQLIRGYSPFAVGDIDVKPIAVPHDATEPAQFIFQANTLRLGILTDLGSITPHVESHYHRCDGLLIEANHDPQMLASGQYPPSLKHRVGGPWGHLSNQQAADFLRRIDCTKLQQLVIGHISQQNNTLSLAQQAFHGLLDSVQSVQFACQEHGFDWISLDAPAAHA